MNDKPEQNETPSVDRECHCDNGSVEVDGSKAPCPICNRELYVQWLDINFAGLFAA